MAWTTPKTWASGYVVLAADLNTHLRDNLNVTAPAVLTTAGDILYASGANTPARLAKDANATRSLTNTGSSNIPAWAQVALDTGVSGTLPVGNGGTGATTFTANGILVGNSTSAVAATATMATKGHVMIGDGSGAPSMLAVGSNDQVLTADSGEATGVKWATTSGASVDFQRFTSTATWTKPAGVTYVMVWMCGGGGSGGAGEDYSGAPNSGGSGGGGGGAVRYLSFNADDLPSALTCTVAGTATGPEGPSSGGSGPDGVNGGLSSIAGTGFVTQTVYGGAGGQGSIQQTAGEAGGGGGGTGTAPSTSTGGGPKDTSSAGTGNRIGGGGGDGGASDTTGGNAEWGGGGGAGGAVGQSAGKTGIAGGSSINGAGGGGSSGAVGSAPADGAGGAGGSWGSYVAGGGGAGSVLGGADAVAGASNPEGCGMGGGGGAGQDNRTSLCDGADGGLPGGGGGGMGPVSSDANGHYGGDGARGEIRIWSI